MKSLWLHSGNGNGDLFYNGGARGDMQNMYVYIHAYCPVKITMKDIESKGSVMTRPDLGNQWTLMIC